MKHKQRGFSYWILISLMTASIGQAQTLSPGSYQRAGNGFMKIERLGKNGEQKFTIESIGSNAHTCEVDGVINNRIAQLIPNGQSPKEQCKIHFKLLRPSQLEVETPEPSDACNSYCGARAYFTGIYEIPPQTCNVENVKLRRHEFLTSYKTHNYTHALKLLESLHRSCQPWLTYDSVIDIRNDLAITYFHLKRNKDCIRITMQFIGNDISSDSGRADNTDSRDNDFELMNKLSRGQPVYEYWARQAIAAARSNLKRCGYQFRS